MKIISNPGRRKETEKIPGHQFNNAVYTSSTQKTHTRHKKVLKLHKLRQTESGMGQHQDMIFELSYL